MHTSCRLPRLRYNREGITGSQTGRSVKGKGLIICRRIYLPWQIDKMRVGTVQCCSRRSLCRRCNMTARRNYDENSASCCTASLRQHLGLTGGRGRTTTFRSLGNLLQQNPARLSGRGYVFSTAKPSKRSSERLSGLGKSFRRHQPLGQVISTLLLLRA